MFCCTWKIALLLLLLSCFSDVQLYVMDGSTPGSPISGILQARTLEWVAISFSNYMQYIHFLTTTFRMLGGFPDLVGNLVSSYVVKGNVLKKKNFSSVQLRRALMVYKWDKNLIYCPSNKYILASLSPFYNKIGIPKSKSNTINQLTSFYYRASLVAQLVKNLPAMGKTWVWSLGWEDPLEKGTATHSSILDWRVHGVAKSQTWLILIFYPFIFISLSCLGEEPTILLTLTSCE